MDIVSVSPRARLEARRRRAAGMHDPALRGSAPILASARPLGVDVTDSAFLMQAATGSAAGSLVRLPMPLHDRNRLAMDTPLIFQRNPSLAQRRHSFDVSSLST